MSNILIIKHGSLGDIIQANGAIKDIKENFSDHKVLLLTTPPYAEFMSICPYIDGVLIDKRLPRWNLFYLNKLKKMLERFSFAKVFDLQNSSRTRFYKKFFFKKDIFWSDSYSFISKEQASEENKLPVLDRMTMQLSRAGVSKILFTKKPDLSWSIKNVQNIINQNFEGNYILIFPFCSPKLRKKKWPYYTELISLLNRDYGSKYNIAIAPGPMEIIEAKNFKASVILNKNLPLNISELISLINGSSYIISNDTGPAHISAHLNKKGLVLFGSHTSPEKVSIETENFKSIKVKNLRDLTVGDVFEKVKENLN
tara:strand:- start:1293 stop:2228 length:936 start_codon:yes stop_codon:yes gene_type:complete